MERSLFVSEELMSFLKAKTRDLKTSNIYYDVIYEIIHLKHICQDLKYVINKLINEKNYHDINLNN